MKAQKELTSTGLKNVLWETLNDLKNKKTTPEVANAIGSQAREILRTVKTELTVIRMTQGDPQAALRGVKNGEQKLLEAFGGEHAPAKKRG